MSTAKMTYVKSKRQRDDVGRTVKGMTILLVVMAVAIRGTLADSLGLSPIAVLSNRERPERAALEPPTVTSLKPSDRSRGGHLGSGSISVRGEVSGGHIPPVVASRSPSSSSNSKDYKNRYTHINSRFYQPSAPVATASSGSRSGSAEVMTGSWPPPDAREVPLLPEPHLMNTTTVSIPHKSSWVPPMSYAPPPPRNTYGSSRYGPVGRTYPRRPGIHGETRVPLPSYVDGGLPERRPPYNTRGGVWGETGGETIGGIWSNTRRHPTYSRGHPRGHDHSVVEDSVRLDTFGHKISEDLSHLGSEYPTGRGGSRRTQARHPLQSGSGIYNPSWESQQPDEEDIHIVNENQYHPQNGHSHVSVQDREEGSLSHSRGSETNPSINRSGMAPTAYGSSSIDGQRTVPREYPGLSTAFDESLEIHRQDGTPAILDAGSTPGPTESARRPLTLYEVSHMINMSTSDEFVDFLKRRGITLGQVLSFMKASASREDMIEFLNKEDLTTTAPPLDSFDVHQRTGDEHRMTDSVLLNPDPSASVIEAEDEGTHRHSTSRGRGERKKKRRKNKNKKRGRKNKENRKRDRNDKTQIVPSIMYTTIIPPTDIRENGSMNHLTNKNLNFTILPVSSSTTNSSSSFESETPRPSKVSIPATSTMSTIAESLAETEISTEHLSYPQFPTRQTHFEGTTAAPPQSTSPLVHLLHHPNLPSRPSTETSFSLERATTPNPVLFPTATTKKIFATPPEVIFPALLTTGFAPTAKTTSFPTSMKPRAGSLTLPPSSKPSEVSIISFTVMKVPPKETVPEEVNPISKRQNPRLLRKNTNRFHTHGTDTEQRHLLPATKKIEGDLVVRTPFVREEKDKYAFPVKGFMIITGIMGALAVFTLVVLISYAIIKCSKQPVVNNYQVSEQKAATQ